MLILTSSSERISRVRLVCFKYDLVIFCAIKTALPKQEIEWRRHKETMLCFVMCLAINFIVQT